MRTVADRFLPGADLRAELERLVKSAGIQAGVLLSLVGSLSSAKLRAAGGTAMLELDCPLEIVSATGTFSCDGVHVHISVADAHGTVTGGHLMLGSTVFTTAEVIIGDISDEWLLTREFDQLTGHQELVIQPTDPKVG